jgi:hypothetical protein
MRRIARLVSPRGQGRIFAAAALLAIVTFATAAEASTLTVTSNADSGPGSLRDAVAAASGGDTIVFAVFGAITLTGGEIAIQKSLDIEGPGAYLLALSGNDRSRIFHVVGGATVTVAGLTLTHGRATEPIGGAAILNLSSTTILRDDVFSFNSNLEGSGPFGPCVWNNPKSAGLFNPAWGGAVSNIGGPPASASCPRSAATLVVTDCAFLFNQTKGAFSKGAEGGAICNHAATATVTGCLFVDNKATGGDGGAIDPAKTTSFICFALGGAIVNRAGSSLTVTDSLFIGNQARGGNNGSGGVGEPGYIVGMGAGGAIHNHDTSSLILNDSAFIGNQAIGGSNNTGATGFSGDIGVGAGDGGALENDGTATITSCIFDHNRAQGGHGNSGVVGDVLVGVGNGGAIFNVGGAGPGSLSLSNVTLMDNEAIGGAGNTGGEGNAVGAFAGDGLGGGLANWEATATVDDAFFSGNQATGGPGALGRGGANGLGGGIANYFGSTLIASNCTLQYNRATGGAGDSGASGGDGFGGGVFNDGLSRWPPNPGAASTLRIFGSTIAGNLATGDCAEGGGVYATSGSPACQDPSTSIAGNAPDDVFTGTDCTGTATDSLPPC